MSQSALAQGRFSPSRRSPESASSLASPAKFLPARASGSVEAGRKLRVRLKLPRVRDVIARYSDGNGRSRALELPKLKRIPRPKQQCQTDELQPQEPIKFELQGASGQSADTTTEPPLSLKQYELAQPARSPAPVSECSTCEERLTKKTCLHVHMLTHSYKKIFRCELCGERFAQRCGLTYHTRRVHTGERPYSCDACGRTFIQKTDLNKHRRVHERYEPTVKCAVCKQSVAESAMERHSSTHRIET